MSGVIELRQYTLKPGRRDKLIALFEREFIESQEAEGMEIIGAFRDLDNPDRFVWLRGFPDMEARTRSLAAFYGGPVWKAHRQAANDTMIDSDNVLLLKPAWDGSGFTHNGTRAPIGAAEAPRGMVAATICYFDAPVTSAAIAALRAEITDARIIAAFVTEPSANTFPRLPVREDENAFVWFMRAGELTVPPKLWSRPFAKPPELLRLLPTTRSKLR